MLEGFDNVKKISVEAAERDGSTVVIVSAFKGITDALLQVGESAEHGHQETIRQQFESIRAAHLRQIAKCIQNEEKAAEVAADVAAHTKELHRKLESCLDLEVLPAHIKDLIASFGERLSALILAASLQADGVDAEFVDARELVKTNDRFGNASVDFEKTNKKIQQHFAGPRKKVSVVTGFIGSNNMGKTTTLGRGGSDYSAAIFAAALGAEEIQIWKETNGVESADPRLVHGTKTVPHMTYAEMHELAVAGAKVVHPPTMRPAEENNIPIRVLNTFEPQHPGTLIDGKENGESSDVKAVSSVKDVAIITVEGSGLHEGPGIARRVFESTEKAGANVLMISQAVSENSICFAVPKSQAEKARIELSKMFAAEMEAGAVSVEVEPDHVIIAAVGENMKGHAGVSSRLFTTLNNSGVSAHMIAQGANELNISVAIPKADLRKALQVVHDEFILSDRKIVNLYLVGPGRVGKEILRRLGAQRGAHLERNGVEFRLAGVINSTRMMVTNNGGIPLEEWEQQLSDAEEADLEEFMSSILKNNLPHSIVVDTTASEAPVKHYEALLTKSVAVVTANKKAFSGSMQRYNDIKAAAKEGNTVIGYETNVGAALPVIGPLRDAIEGGDEVKRIDGMLSGTLGYIFSSFDGSKPFSEVVYDAYKLGYTEPNPADDLNLSDVARKIVILAREAGAQLELSEVEITPILSPECLKAQDTETFFAELKKSDEQFDKLYRAAVAEGKRLRVIERYENGEASISLMMIGPDHSAYHLSGPKNVVEYTTRDHENGWQVSGAGAGIEVTASGVIADLVKAAKHT